MKTATVHVSKMDALFLPESRVRECINVTIVFAILEVIFVSLFFFARFKNKTTNGWDFYFMVPAFLCCYCIIVVNICKFNHNTLIVGDAHTRIYSSDTIRRSWTPSGLVDHTRDQLLHEVICHHAIYIRACSNFPQIGHLGFISTHLHDNILPMGELFSGRIHNSCLDNESRVGLYRMSTI